MAAVAQVGGEAGPGPHRLADCLRFRRRMSQGHPDSAGHDPADELNRPRPLRGQRNQADQAPGRFLPGAKLLPIRIAHELRVVSAAGAVLRGDVGPLPLDAGYDRAQLCRGADRLGDKREILEDQRPGRGYDGRKVPGSAGNGQVRDYAFQLLRAKIGPAVVAAPVAVDLDIDETRGEVGKAFFTRDPLDSGNGFLLYFNADCLSGKNINTLQFHVTPHPLFVLSALKIRLLANGAFLSPKNLPQLIQTKDEHQEAAYRGGQVGVTGGNIPVGIGDAHPYLEDE